MIKASVLFVLVAICAMAVNARISYHSRKTMREMTQRLHHTYGVGLKHLVDPVTGHLNIKERNGRASLTINGVTMDTKQAKSFLLGWASGMQFTDKFFSKCFYAIMDLTSSVDYIKSDAKKMISEGAYYNLIFYDPIHFMANSIAGYEYCSANKYLNYVALVASGDYGFLADLGVRNIIDIFTKYPDEAKGVAKGLAKGNYYRAGKHFGKMWKNMFNDNQKA